LTPKNNTVVVFLIAIVLYPRVVSYCFKYVVAFLYPNLTVCTIFLEKEIKGFAQQKFFFKKIQKEFA
jgi:hypothetical protein